MFNLNNFAWKRKSYLIFDSLFLSFHYSILPAIIIRMEFAQDMVTASDYIYTEKKKCLWHERNSFIRLVEIREQSRNEFARPPSSSAICPLAFIYISLIYM